MSPITHLYCMHPTVHRTCAEMLLYFNILCSTTTSRLDYSRWTLDIPCCHDGINRNLSFGPSSPFLDALVRDSGRGRTRCEKLSRGRNARHADGTPYLQSTTVTRQTEEDERATLDSTLLFGNKGSAHVTVKPFQGTERQVRETVRGHGRL